MFVRWKLSWKVDRTSRFNCVDGTLRRPHTSKFLSLIAHERPFFYRVDPGIVPELKSQIPAKF